MPLGAFAKTGRINAENLDTAPRLAGGINFFRVLVGTAAADHALAEANWLDAAGRRELETIFDLAAGVEESAKGIQLGKMLAARQSKAVVFTEFFPTLDHLRRVCEQHDVPYAFFSGELSRA